MKMNINRHLLPVKGAYFCYYAGVANIMPYIGVFMKTIGLTHTETGIITAVRLFLGAFMRPVTGYASDRFKMHKTILIISLMLGPLINLVLYFTPESHSNKTLDEKTGTFRFNCFRNDIVHRLSVMNISSKDLVISENCEATCILSEGTINLTQICIRNSFNISNCDSSLNSKELSVNDNFTTRSVITSIDEDIHMDDTTEMKNIMSIWNISHGGGIFHKITCIENSKIVCENKCENQATESTSVKNEAQAAFSISFYFFLIFYSLCGMIVEPISSLIDAIVYSHLGEARDKWGKQRLWGTIGFSLFSLIIGLTMHLSSKDNSQRRSYLPGFIGYSIVLIFSALITSTYSKPTQHKNEKDAQNLKHLIRNVNLLIIFFIVFVFGMFYGVINTFLFWHLETLGATQLLMGLSLIMTCTLEIPALYVSGWIIKKIGEINCIYLSWIAYAIRFVCYSFLSNPWMVLLIEPIHCINYGLMYAAVTSYGSSVTPEGYHGSVQGMISALFNGFGKGIGSLVIGPVFEKFGPSVAFFSVGICSLVMFILHITYETISRCTENKSDDKTKDTLADLTEEKIAMNEDKDHTKESNEIPNMKPLLNEKERIEITA